MKSSDKTPTPPRFFLKFFRWFCRASFLEDIEGDLLERFEDNSKHLGIRKAKWLFAKDTILLFRPGIIKSSENYDTLNSSGMFKNYSKIAFRVFRKEKIFTGINIIGLALSLTCSLFIYLWVQNELKYNSFISDDRVCSVKSNSFYTNGNIETGSNIPAPLKTTLEEKYPVVEKAALTDWANPMIFKKETGNFQIKGIHASPEIFEIFEFSFLKGGVQRMYEHPETIAISESFAENFFGADWEKANIIGKVIYNNYNEPREITGVFANIPDHSTLRFDCVVPFELKLKARPWLQHWGNFASLMYVKIVDQIPLDEANESIRMAIIDNRPDEETTEEIFLQPFRELHLYNTYENGQVAGGRVQYVRIMSMAAVLILIIASINFMNLATARSTRRSKETGIRKTLGAFKASIRFQFLLESIFIAFFAILVAGGLVIILLPSFNELTEVNIQLNFFSAKFILISLGFSLGLGFLSGIYPAFYMASFSPTKSLKGVIKHGVNNVVIRKGLVVFQFFITIVMILGTLIIYKQLLYIQNKNIGIDKENLINVYMNDMDPAKDYLVYRDKLLRMPGIESVTTASTGLLNITNSTSDPIWDGKLENELQEFDILSTDPDFIKTSKLILKEGRNFDWSITTDTANFIINEEAAKVMRMEDPIGQDLEFWDRKGKIIGVAKDFHNHSLHTPIKPMIIRYDMPMTWLIFIRTKAGETQEALASLESLHKEFHPDREFSYRFTDDVYQWYYQSEMVVKDLALYFTIFAIIISCLGLLGLIIYSSEQRTKEIGIRKALGASVTSILQLLCKDFLLLISISLVLAIPISYFVMQHWLENFAYKTNMSWWLFAVAGAITFVISIITISGNAIRAALINPTDSLRQYE
ncbi:ABC transporter permease [Fulvivirgaceae bacterium BMA10]|uniref:ABC transporter permease n=1 Tax=Splendidivirga corallicola TaxID=3051826 RepID=A0ABT8KYL0_9BACT|nr:ABC transporter permease [Fulvivirgaceae bacterium BMA10]